MTKKKEDIQLGNKIRELRISLNYNQKQFAYAIGATVSALSNWENGRNKPNANKLDAIAKLGSTTVEELLNGYSDKEKKFVEEKIFFDPDIYDDSKVAKYYTRFFSYLGNDIKKEYTRSLPQLLEVKEAVYDAVLKIQEVQLLLRGTLSLMDKNSIPLDTLGAISVLKTCLLDSIKVIDENSFQQVDEKIEKQAWLAITTYRFASVFVNKLLNGDMSDPDISKKISLARKIKKDSLNTENINDFIDNNWELYHDYFFNGGDLPKNTRFGNSDDATT